MMKIASNRNGILDIAYGYHILLVARLCKQLEDNVKTQDCLDRQLNSLNWIAQS